MEDFLKQLVSEDTPEAWESLRSQMPWNQAGKDDAAIAALDIDSVDIDLDDPEALSQAVSEGKVWMEFYVDPSLTIGSGFIPYILNCQQIICLTPDSLPLSSPEVLVAEKAKPAEIEGSAISFLVVACPRCHLMSTKGDEDIEFEPDEDLIDSNCIACQGSGEWEYELL